MPIVNIQMFEGRTVEQKRLLCQSVHQAIVDSLGVSADAVTIVLQDMKPEDYCKAGQLRHDQLNKG